MYFDRIVEMEKRLSKEKKSFASDIAKGLVSVCIRNNTVLENVHTGEVELTDKTMKQLMIECTNNMYMFILSLFFGGEYEYNVEEQITIDEFAQMFLTGQFECKNWNDAELPEWAKR